jgi:hypothetical protein
MNRTGLLRTVVVAVVSITLGMAPKASLAQRGTHGMGGGFHVGGGGFHHGGNGFSGFGGGFYGGPRGLWGYPGYGYGVSVGFGFGPYWGAYPYWYGYGPWWGPSSYYPYNPYYYPRTTDPSYPPDCRNSPDYRHDDVPPSSSNPDGDNAPAEPSSTPTPEAFPDPDTVTTYSVAYRPIISRVRPDPNNAVENNHKLAGSSARLPSSGLRPAVRNAIQALRAMPPWAQQRWLDSGRYDNFTPQERKLLKDGLRLPQAE